MIARYLHQCHYKLTAVTLAEEAGAQSLDDLKAVGLADGREADLLLMVRDRIQPLEDAAALRGQVDELRAQLTAAETKLAKLEHSNGILRKKLEQKAVSEAADATAERKQAFLATAAGHSYTEKSGDDDDEDGGVVGAATRTADRQHRLVDFLAQQVGKMLKASSSKTRPALVELLSLVAGAHSDPGVRAELTTKLLHSVRKSDEEETRVVADAVIRLAAELGPSGAENDVLPAVLQLAMSSSAERRALASLLCGRLGAVVNSVRWDNLIATLSRVCVGQRRSEWRGGMCGSVGV